MTDKEAYEAGLRFISEADELEGDLQPYVAVGRLLEDIERLTRERDAAVGAYTAIVSRLAGIDSEKPRHL